MNEDTTCKGSDMIVAKSPVDDFFYVNSGDYFKALKFWS